MSGGKSGVGPRWFAGGTTLALVIGLFSVALADDDPLMEVAGAPEFDAGNHDVTLEEGETRQVDLNALTSDPDDDALIFAVSGLPSYASFNRSTDVITLSPTSGDAHPPRTITVTAYKDVGFNQIPGGLTQLWSRQVGQSSGDLPDRNRVLAGYQVVNASSVGQSTASGSGQPTGGATAPSERNRSAFTVVLNPETPGVAPGFEGAASNAVVNASSRTLGIARPGGVQAGDFLLAHVRYRHQEPQNGGPPPDGAPNLTAEGWTKVETIEGPSQANHTLMWKWFEPTDPNPYVFNENDPTGRMAGGIVAFSGVDPLSPIQAWALAEPGSGLVAPALNVGSRPTVVVRMWGWHGYSASLPNELPDPPHSDELTPSTSFDVSVTEPSDDPTTTTTTSPTTTTTSPTTTTTSPSTTTTTPTSTPTTTTTTTPTTPSSEPEVKPSTDWFVDDDGHLFEDDINGVATVGYARGCNPPANDRYCPEDLVTRGQMAAFLVRALGYSADGGGDLFTDDDGHVFEGDIDRLAAAGVTRGCNPPVNDRFCPDDELTRGAMAAFLVRALGYSDDGGGDLFTDDDGHVFEADIDRLATAGVTRGCNPPDNSWFCPDDELTRGQMAAFLARSLLGND